MPMIGYKTRISPNNKQKSVLQHWCNARRYAYNYALGLTLIEMENLPEGEKWNLNRINDYDKMFNQGKTAFGSIKKTKSGTVNGSGTHTWIAGVPSSVTQQAIKYDLKSGWQRCFKKLGGRPKFKSKYGEQHFKLSNGDLKCKNVLEKHITHRKLGSIKLGQKVPNSIRNNGRVMNTTFSLKTGVWWVSFIYEVPSHIYYSIKQGKTKCIGIDLGVKHQATIYDSGSDKSWHSEYPKDRLKSLNNKIRCKQRLMSKLKRGSRKYNKIKAQIAKTSNKMALVRKDSCHKLSKELTTTAHTIAMEDLNISNMTRSSKSDSENHGKMVKQKSGLNREILNMSLHELKTQLQYKSERYGSYLLLVDPKYTSQTCSSCGFKSKDNRKTQASFECLQCGHKENADVNAAKNILNKALTSKTE